MLSCEHKISKMFIIVFDSDCSPKINVHDSSFGYHHVTPRLSCYQCMYDPQIGGHLRVSRTWHTDSSKGRSYNPQTGVVYELFNALHVDKINHKYHFCIPFMLLFDRNESAHHQFSKAPYLWI
jgi:hypothetical protein